MDCFRVLVSNRPISVYRLGAIPIQSCGQSVSAPCGTAGARLHAHTELRAKRQRSARETIYRNRPIQPLAVQQGVGGEVRADAGDIREGRVHGGASSSFESWLILQLRDVQLSKLEWIDGQNQLKLSRSCKRESLCRFPGNLKRRSPIHEK